MLLKGLFFHDLSGRLCQNQAEHKILIQVKAFKKLEEVLSLRTFNYMKIPDIETGYLVHFRRASVDVKGVMTSVVKLMIQSENKSEKSALSLFY